MSARRDFESAQGAVGLHQAIGLLAFVGLGIAGYMAYTNLAGGSLVCGGVGDCDAVQASAYAKVLGVPVSVLGFVSYVAIIALLAGRLWLGSAAGYLALLGILAIVVAGTVFSAYLTYVELFVIHAVCPWCVASAVVIALIAGLAAVAVRREIGAANYASGGKRN